MFEKTIYFGLFDIPQVIAGGIILTYVYTTAPRPPDLERTKETPHWLLWCGASMTQQKSITSTYLFTSNKLMASNNES